MNLSKMFNLDFRRWKPISSTDMPRWANKIYDRRVGQGTVYGRKIFLKGKHYEYKINVKLPECQGPIPAYFYKRRRKGR